MPTGYQIANQGSVYYLTLQVVCWIDIFTRLKYKDIIIDSMKYCIENKGLEVFAYIIMSNHIHLIVRAKNENLSDVIRDFKRHTSKQILNAVEDETESRKEWMLHQFKYAAGKHVRNDKYQLWTHENHAIELYSGLFFKDKLNYLHFNSVRAGIVERPEEYIYSSAKNYIGEKGLLDVVVVDHGMLGIDKVNVRVL